MEVDVCYFVFTFKVNPKNVTLTKYKKVSKGTGCLKNNSFLSKLVIIAV